MQVPAVIAPGEELGRRVFSARDARRARRSGVRPGVFMVKPPNRFISVDRLSIGPRSELIAIAERASASRSGPFRGWASVVAETAWSDGRRALGSPVDGNPYHGDIVLPETAETDLGIRLSHAQRLAGASRWCEPATETER